MTGFPQATLDLLAGIAAHNDRAWFEANRPLYEAGYVEPARAFVAELGPLLREVSPSVQFEPKINGSISRINRDIRFSKDKRPYKDHLDLFFWHGEKRSWDAPGFWLRLTPTTLMAGSGMHHFADGQLDAFRQSVIHPRSGKALLSTVAEVSAHETYEIGGKTRKLPPRGLSTDPERAEYLLHEGLFAMATRPVAEAVSNNFAAQCYKIFSETWPVGRWLLTEISA